MKIVTNPMLFTDCQNSVGKYFLDGGGGAIPFKKYFQTEFRQSVKSNGYVRIFIFYFNFYFIDFTIMTS